MRPTQDGMLPESSATPAGRTCRVLLGDRWFCYHVEGATRWGGPEILLDTDDDLTALAPWSDLGFTVAKLMDAEEHVRLVDGITAIIAAEMSAVGADPGPDFILEQYHREIGSADRHLALWDRTRGVYDLAAFPADLDALTARVSDLVGIDLEIFDTAEAPGVFGIRIVRPNEGDHNPPHRDAWLDRLRGRSTCTSRSSAAAPCLRYRLHPAAIGGANRRSNEPRGARRLTAYRSLCPASWTATVRCGWSVRIHHPGAPWCSRPTWCTAVPGTSIRNGPGSPSSCASCDAADSDGAPGDAWRGSRSPLYARRMFGAHRGVGIGSSQRGCAAMVLTLVVVVALPGCAIADDAIRSGAGTSLTTTTVSAGGIVPDPLGIGTAPVPGQGPLPGLDLPTSPGGTTPDGAPLPGGTEVDGAQLPGTGGTGTGGTTGSGETPARGATPV